MLLRDRDVYGPNYKPSAMGMPMIENLSRAIAAYYRHEPEPKRMSFDHSHEVSFDDDDYLVLRDDDRRIIAVYRRRFGQKKLRRINRWPKQVEDCYPDADGDLSKPLWY